MHMTMCVSEAQQHLSNARLRPLQLRLDELDSLLHVARRLRAS